MQTCFLLVAHTKVRPRQFIASSSVIANGGSIDREKTASYFLSIPYKTDFLFEVYIADGEKWAYWFLSIEKGNMMFRFIFIAVFSAACMTNKTSSTRYYTLTPKACGECTEKGGVVILKDSNTAVEVIYNCPLLLPQHRQFVAYTQKAQIKYLAALNCVKLGTNPPWIHFENAK